MNKSDDNIPNQINNSAESELANINSARALKTLNEKISSDIMNSDSDIIEPSSLASYSKIKMAIKKKQPKRENKHNRIISKKKTRQRLLYISLFFLLVLVPFFFWEKYFINLTFNSDINNKNSIAQLKGTKKFLIRLLAILICYCYLLSVFTSSSQTNLKKYFKINNNKDIDNCQGINSQLWGGYCIFCRTMKFKRSHHCDICGECILFRNLHSKFIINCVGFNNIQFIVNLLIWSIFALFLFESICISYFFSSYRIVKNNFHKLVLTLDFLINIPLLLYFCRCLKLLFKNIYNNKTKLENIINPFTENFYLLYSCNSTDNKGRTPNIWNIGFLLHFYYIIGPSLLHLFLPLPKMMTYILSENCPIFVMFQQFNDLELCKFLMKRDSYYLNELNRLNVSPEKYIEISRQKYKDRKIL